MGWRGRSVNGRVDRLYARRRWSWRCLNIEAPIVLGTETPPALALGREPAEPGIMSRFELVFAATLIWTPGVQEVVGTAPLPRLVLGLIATFRVIVWGVDELRRAGRRRRQVGR